MLSSRGFSRPRDETHISCTVGGLFATEPPPPVELPVCLIHHLTVNRFDTGAPGGSEGKKSACGVGDLGSIPVSGRSPGEGNAHPLRHSCLEKPMDRGAWQATVHGVAGV